MLGESFSDARHETETNPVKKLRIDNALTFNGEGGSIYRIYLLYPSYLSSINLSYPSILSTYHTYLSIYLSISHIYLTIIYVSLYISTLSIYPSIYLPYLSIPIIIIHTYRSRTSYQCSEDD